MATFDVSAAGGGWTDPTPLDVSLADGLTDFTPAPEPEPSFDMPSSFLAGEQMFPSAYTDLGPLTFDPVPLDAAPPADPFRTDLRGPNKAVILNVNPGTAGQFLRRTGTGLEAVGAGMALAPPPADLWAGPTFIAGAALNGLGSLLGKVPGSGSFIWTSTLNDLSEPTSVWLGWNTQDKTLPNSLQFAVTSSANWGGPDLNRDGTGDGAFGLARRDFTAMPTWPNSYGQVSGSNYVSMFPDVGWSATVVGGPIVHDKDPSTARLWNLLPTRTQFGIRLPTDPQQLGNMAMDELKQLGRQYDAAIGNALDGVSSGIPPGEADRWIQIYTDMNRGP